MSLRAFQVEPSAMTTVTDRGQSPVRFVSLGETCQTAYQIRRFTGNSEAYFFDWLITPSDAYRSLFASDDDFFQSGNWQLVDHGGIRLLDRGTMLKFQHEFKLKGPAVDPARARWDRRLMRWLRRRLAPVVAIWSRRARWSWSPLRSSVAGVAGRADRHDRSLSSAIIDELQVESHLATAKSKFLHLKYKTITAIHTASSIYLVRYEGIASREQALARIADIRRYYTATNPKIRIILASPVIDEELAGSDYLVLRIAASESWRGDDASWDRVFRTALRTLDGGEGFDHHCGHGQV